MSYNTRNEYYISGNTVRKTNRGTRPAPRLVEAPKPAHRSIGIGYLLSLIMVMCLAGMMLVYYVSLQSDVTSSVKEISRLESSLNSLKLSNDEEYNRITASIDLEEVKKIAIHELGMQYAEDGQVVSYSSKNSDYVRQYKDIP